MKHPDVVAATEASDRRRAWLALVLGPSSMIAILYAVAVFS